MSFFFQEKTGKGVEEGFVGLEDWKKDHPQCNLKKKISFLFKTTHYLKG